VTWLWLTVLTGTRLFVCVPLWVWCWLRRPRGMVWIMAVAFAWFVASDFVDGSLAREHGLESRTGFWLDRLGDLVGGLAVLASLILGSREAAAGPRRSRARGAARGGGTPPP
jgi:phosphatidylglycerophosphate synthase